MDVNSIAFYFLSGVAVISAVLMVTRRSAVHSAIFLIITLLATAGIFLQLQAEFLFAVQIILYVGGIMVLFLFVIMLVNLEVSMRQMAFKHRGWVAALLTLILGGQLLVAFRYGASAFNLQPPPVALMPPNAEQVGQGLFQSYLLPFEIASILLLVAMVGATVMSKKEI